MKPFVQAPSRREFLRVMGGVAGGLVLADCARAGAEDAPAAAASDLSVLPQGATPDPVALPHFPDRLHAFVWRNWPLVPVDRLARVIGATPAEVTRLGRALGLGRPPRITRDQQRRSHLTVIKRNWQLLPYEQLLELLDWTPEKLAYTLREDDFLFVKLGNLKPRCAPLRYQPSSDAWQRRERQIAGLVREEFAQGVELGADPMFGFVARLSKRPAGSVKPAVLPGLRFGYSYFALYGDPLLETETESYPEGYLARLAAAGVNGVWLQAVLYKLARFPWEPERSDRHEERLENLRALVARAGRHGIRVFLYLNEPRAMPLRFFETRPELKGAVEGDHASMCTSVPEVRAYMTESIASICRAVPELGGFFTITGSENLTHCWSHGGGAGCPRCGRRPGADVVAEANRLVADGIRQAGSQARLLAWDWGWNDAWTPEIIRQLPKEAGLMSVSEWSLPIERGGVKSEVGEYSISAIGPGPRARRHWELARQRGLKTYAKIQAGNTWELSSVPWIPAVENVARHAVGLRELQMDGLMLGWTLGGYPSVNLEVVGEGLAGGSVAEVLQRVAERRFGRALAPAVVTAWRGFSAAFREFPYHGGVVYSAPQQLGPANLLWEAPTGYRATMVGFPYDDLDGWRAIYPVEAFIGQFEKVATGFEEALVVLTRAAAEGKGKLTRDEERALEEELSVAEASGIHFRSVANQARFVATRRQLTGGARQPEAGGWIDELERILREEIRLARRLHVLQSRDSRLGFEASNQYFFVPADLAEKVLNCRDLVDRWIPGLRSRFRLAAGANASTEPPHS